MKKSVISILKKLTSFKKSKWKNDGRLRVLIAVNSYFSKQKWEECIANQYSSRSKEWDLIYVKGKFEIARNFDEADVCFLHGYSILNNPKNSKPKLLYFPMVGLDFIENKKLRENFTILKPPVLSAKAIAEYCLSQTINISRNLQYAYKFKHERKWEQGKILHKQFISLSDLKIGILGVGNIGLAVAECFWKQGCSVIGYDKKNSNTETYINHWFGESEISAFMSACDVVIITLPLTPETKNLIQYKELEHLGPSGYLINVSRGAIVNEDDLIRVLEKKKIAGAVLDVFSREPLASSSKFYELDNVIVTPHIAGNINYFIPEIQCDFFNKIIDCK